MIKLKVTQNKAGRFECERFPGDTVGLGSSVFESVINWASASSCVIGTQLQVTEPDGVVCEYHVTVTKS